MAFMIEASMTLKEPEPIVFPSVTNPPELGIIVVTVW